jgi:hypothetical protein
VSVFFRGWVFYGIVQMRMAAAQYKVKKKEPLTAVVTLKDQFVHLENAN